jgi:hypothetical protein
MNPLAPYMAWIKLAAFAVVVLSAMAYGNHKGAQRVQGKFDKHLLADAQADAQAQRKAIEAARKFELRQSFLLSQIVESYDEGKRDAEAAGKSVTDGLRAGNLKLRKQWQGCEADRVSNPSAGAAEPDAAADSRAESVGRITRAVNEAEAQIRGLQDVLRGERK